MSAIYNIKINNQDVEVVAYGDIYEYVQDADLTHYRVTGPYMGKYTIFSSKPYNDPDLAVVGEPILLNDNNLYIPVNFGEDDERTHAVNELGLYNDIYCVYIWNEDEKLYVYFSGPYATEENALEKIEELRK